MRSMQLPVKWSDTKRNMMIEIGMRGLPDIVAVQSSVIFGTSSAALYKEEGAGTVLKIAGMRSNRTFQDL